MIEKMLTEERIAVGVECASWREAVKASGSLLVKAEDVDEPFIQSMIEVVEEFGPYMILAPELAFFHGRPGKSVHKTCLSLITLKDTVRFTDFNGEKIKAAFAFGAIDSKSHIEALKELAKLLQNEEFLGLVRNIGDKDKILEIIKCVCST